MIFQKSFIKSKLNAIIFLFFGGSFLVTSGQSNYYELNYSLDRLQRELNGRVMDLRPLLTNEETELIQSVQVKVVEGEGVPAAISEKNGNGEPVITFSAIFLRSVAKVMDALLIQGSVNSEAKTFRFISNYASNSAMSNSDPAQFFELSGPDLELYQSEFTSNARYGYFLVAMNFVLLHEYAHHILGHLDGNGLSQKEKINNEISADKWANEMFAKSGWPSALVVPLMYYFHLLDSFNEADEMFTHPSGISRVSQMVNSSLTNLEFTYNQMIKLAPVSMSYEKMYQVLFDVGLDVYTESFNEMTEGFDEYEEAAEEGDVSAQIKMGVMYFKGVNGWEKDKIKGYKWLRVAASNSDFASLLLGMFNEHDGRLEKARHAYQNSANLGNHYAKIMLSNLNRFNESEEAIYKTEIPKFMIRMKEGCIRSCVNEYGIKLEVCKVDHCNYSFNQMYFDLSKFHRTFLR